MSRRVAILAFDDMEVLDFAGPYEVFNVAGELTDPAAFTVDAVGAGPGPVVGRGGFTVVAAHALADAPLADVLVVPGGAGVRRLLDDVRLLDSLREQASQVEVLMSVCTGSLLLAAAGLLSGCRATTHHAALDELAALDPSLSVQRGQRFVHSAERIWTSAGVSAGVDLALQVVELLAGRDARDATVGEMEWMWDRDVPDRTT